MVTKRTVLSLSIMCILLSGCQASPTPVLALSAVSPTPQPGPTNTLAAPKGEWTVYKMANPGLPAYSVYALAMDAQGSLWIGTGGGGLARFDGGTWTAWESDNSGLPGDTIYALDIDAQGTIWIGTKGGGLARFDRQECQVYSAANSQLPGNTVHAVAIGAQGGMDWHRGRPSEV